MKIVHIEDFFHPNAGYQLNILSKYMVKHGFEITIITAEMDLIPDYLTSFFGKQDIEKQDQLFEETYKVKIIRMPVKRYISGRVIFDNNSVVRAIHAEKPDIVYVHGNDTYTGLWLIYHFKRLGCPIITDSHMVAIASNNRFRSVFYLFYRLFITPVIVRNHITVIRTTNENYVHKYLGIPLDQAPVITFGSDTMLFHPDKEIKKEFRITNSISESAFVIMYAGKLDEAKGGGFLAAMTCEELDTDREVVFLIVGNTVGEFGEKVEKHFSESKYRILRLPTQKYSDLSKLYQSADIAVIPRQCSLSFFDMQACGLPVLAEDNPINIERCSDKNGWVFRSENLPDFKTNLERIINLDTQLLYEVSQNASNLVLEKYNYETKSREYEQAIIDAISN